MNDVTCQECGNLVEEEFAMKVTGDGWVCYFCGEDWKTGNDYR